jgi:hypothetical protein
MKLLDPSTIKFLNEQDQKIQVYAILSNEKQGTSKINKIKITKISLISNSVSNPLVNFDFATHTCKVRRLRTPSP